MNRGFFSKLGLGGERGSGGGGMCANFSSISNSELLPHPIWFSPHQWVIGFIYPPKCLLILSLALYLSTGFVFSLSNLLRLFISSLSLSLSLFFPLVMYLIFPFFHTFPLLLIRYLSLHYSVNVFLSFSFFSSLSLSCYPSFHLSSSKTTKLILLDSLLQEKRSTAKMESSSHCSWDGEYTA